MLEEKIKLLSPNIKAVVEHVLKNKIVSVYNSANIPLTGTNEDTIDIIRSQIAAFQEYKEAHPQLKVSISSWAKQKQIYKITMVGRENTYLQDRKIIAWIFFSDLYPVKPPVVYFEDINVNGTYERYKHVNVFTSSGNLCQQIIKAGYQETIHIKDFLISIEDTLYNPNASDPANGELASLYKRPDQKEYNEVIRRQAQYLEWDDIDDQ